MKEAIRERALELGFDGCRFTSAAAPESAPRLQEWLAQGQHGEMAYLARNASKRVEPQRVLPGAKTVVILAASYAGDEDTTSASPAGPPGQTTGVVARYARFRDYHKVLGGRLKILAQFMDQLGGSGTRSLWYVDTGPVLERDLAQRSGLGFIGKHTNLVSRQLGNWIFLAEVLTTLELEPDSPERNRCGSCVRCLTACPTRAILAPFQLDARRCISYLTIEQRGPIPLEFRGAMGARIYGCDDCLAACPWNRFARQGRLMKGHARPDLATLDLLELLALDEGGFRRRFEGTPILRARRAGLLRNVCVGIGNVGDRRALPALQKASEDVEPLVAEHARWAIERLEAKG